MTYKHKKTPMDHLTTGMSAAAARIRSAVWFWRSEGSVLSSGITGSIRPTENARPLGSLIGALTLGGLQNGLTLMNVPSFWQYVASGVVVILAVYVDRLARPAR